MCIRDRSSVHALGSVDYEVPRRDRVGRKIRRRGAADQIRRVVELSGARMTDVRAVWPAVTHPEHRESSDRDQQRIRGARHSRTDVRSIADSAHTGRLLVKVDRAGDAVEGQVEDPGVDLPRDIAVRIRVNGDLERVLEARGNGLESAAGDPVRYYARAENRDGGWRDRPRVGHGFRAATGQHEGKKE